MIVIKLDQSRIYDTSSIGDETDNTKGQRQSCVQKKKKRMGLFKPREPSEDG